MWETYAAAAEKTSTILPFVSRPSPSEKIVVKIPMMVSRMFMLLTKYSTTIDPTSKSEAMTVPTTALRRAMPS